VAEKLGGFRSLSIVQAPESVHMNRRGHLVTWSLFLEFDNARIIFLSYNFRFQNIYYDILKLVVVMRGVGRLRFLFLIYLKAALC